MSRQGSPRTTTKLFRHRAVDGEDGKLSILEMQLGDNLLEVWKGIRPRSKKGARLTNLPQIIPQFCQPQISGHLRLRWGRHEKPDFAQIWRSGGDAVRSLASRDETAMLRACEEGRYVMQGRLAVALWFNE